MRPHLRYATTAGLIIVSACATDLPTPPELPRSGTSAEPNGAPPVATIASTQDAGDAPTDVPCVPRRVIHPIPAEDRGHVTHLKFIGEHFVYEVRDGGLKAIVASGGRRYADGISNQSPILLTDGRVIYPVKDGKKEYISVNGTPGPSFDTVYYRALTPDGKNFAYMAKQGSRYGLVKAPAKAPEAWFDGLDYPTFDSEGRLSARVMVGGKAAMIHADKLGPIFSEIPTTPPILSDTGDSIAYPGRAGWEWAVVRNHATVLECDERPRVRGFAPGSEEVVSICKRRTNYSVFRGATPIAGPFKARPDVFLGPGEGDEVVFGDGRVSFDRHSVPGFTRLSLVRHAKGGRFIAAVIEDEEHTDVALFDRETGEHTRAGLELPRMARDVLMGDSMFLANDDLTRLLLLFPPHVYALRHDGAGRVTLENTFDGTRLLGARAEDHAPIIASGYDGQELRIGAQPVAKAKQFVNATAEDGVVRWRAIEEEAITAGCALDKGLARDGTK